jgi:hypothetical protein
LNETKMLQQFTLGHEQPYKYTSQQKKWYKGLMLKMFYIEKKNRQKSYNLDSYGHSQ